MAGKVVTVNAVGHQHGHDHQHCVEDAMQRADLLCAQRQVRFTALRRQVLALVWSSHEAVKAYDLIEKLSRQSSEQIKPPTIYRALEFLLAQGLIHRVESLNAYVGCPHPEHPHVGMLLICSVCGVVAELDSPTITEALTTNAQNMNFTIHHQMVEVTGTCAGCSALHPTQP